MLSEAHAVADRLSRRSQRACSVASKILQPVAWWSLAHSTIPREVGSWTCSNASCRGPPHEARTTATWNRRDSDSRL